jgi:HAD superfamily hydrolase (TIGR01484 family)
MKTILLCSDLDRTLIPNGSEPESPRARAVFAHLTAHPRLRLAYVSGRDKQLIEKAIKGFDLPEPDFVIGDVGTTLYRIIGGRWLFDESWQLEIGRDWGNHDRNDIAGLLSDIKEEGFYLQPPEKQSRYKISYFTPAADDPKALMEAITAVLGDHGVLANLIWSRDDAAQRGLIDIVPRRANKLAAIRFLMKTEQIDESQVLFAGDSGNDLDALTSGLKAILVHNAAADVRQTALANLSRRNMRDRLYPAKGGWGGMNGNYAAGVLEGVVHFFPEASGWLKSVI